MTDTYGKNMDVEGDLQINKRDFTISTVDDEIRADQLCRKVLKRFYLQLMEEGMTPERATELASSADYFLRDFVVDFKGANLFDEHPGIVRQFAGNWYIVNTLEPNIREITGHLAGIKAFYRYLRQHGLVSASYLRNIEKECDDLPYYEHRIESFWGITGDGYLAWERECSLKSAGRTRE